MPRSFVDHSMSTRQDPVFVGNHAVSAGLPNPRPTHHACPVCQTDSGSELGELRFAYPDQTSLPDHHDVVACSRCGFVRCDSPVDQTSYDRFYNSYQYSPAYLERRPTEQELACQDRILAAIRPFLRGSRQAIVDVGCGTGTFLKRCRERGQQSLYGVDLSTNCVTSLQQDALTAQVGSLAELPFRDVSVGAIVAAHTLEHVADPSSCLRSLRERLATGGVVYIEVPDTSRFEESQPKAPLRYFYPQHIVHFDGHHLDQLFRAHGFRKIAGGTCCRFENELVIPAVSAIYEVDTGIHRELQANFDLARQVVRYFTSTTLDPERAFADLAESQRRVFVWGIGIHIQMLLGMSPLGDCNIVACVDQDPRLHGSSIDGHPIDSLAALNSAEVADVVVIGSSTHRQSMERYLREEVSFHGEIVTI